MHAFLIAATIGLNIHCDWDKEPNGLSIVSYESNEALQRAETPLQPPAPDPAPSVAPVQAAMPTVTLVTDPSWCAPCRSLEASIAEYGEQNLPFKIERRKPRDGESIPQFVWGGWHHIGYEPIDKFIRRWRYANSLSDEKPQTPEPSQGRLCQCVAVTGNRQAYCPCLPLGKGCHCSPSKPHRFD